MIKNSLVISALLSTSKVQAVKHVTMQTSQSLLETSDHQVDQRNLEAEYVLYGEDAIRVIEEEAYLDASSGLGYTPTSCKSGIERFLTGSSNSDATWNAANTAAAKWEDPEFGADDSSLSWGGFGFGKEYDAPPNGL